MPKLKDLGALEPDMGSIEDKVGQLKQGLRSSFSDAVTKNPVGAAAKSIGRMMKDANVRVPSKPDPADADIFTADKGIQPPMDDDMGSAMPPVRPTGERQKKAAKDIRAAMGMKKGGKVSSASKRADGIATKGKTKGRFV